MRGGVVSRLSTRLRRSGGARPASCTCAAPGLTNHDVQGLDDLVVAPVDGELQCRRQAGRHGRLLMRLLRSWALGAPTSLGWRVTHTQQKLSMCPGVGHAGWGHAA